MIEYANIKFFIYSRGIKTILFYMKIKLGMGTKIFLSVNFYSDCKNVIIYRDFNYLSILMPKLFYKFFQKLRPT